MVSDTTAAWTARFVSLFIFVPPVDHLMNDFHVDCWKSTCSGNQSSGGGAYMHKLGVTAV